MRNPIYSNLRGKNEFNCEDGNERKNFTADEDIFFLIIYADPKKNAIFIKPVKTQLNPAFEVLDTTKLQITNATVKIPSKPIAASNKFSLLPEQKL